MRPKMSGRSKAREKSQIEEIAIRNIEIRKGFLNLTFKTQIPPISIPIVSAARLYDHNRGPVSGSLKFNGPSTESIDSNAILISEKANTIAITQEREINSRQPTIRSCNIPGLASFTFPMMGRNQTITPAIKNEIASASKPQPEPTVATRIPPERVPTM